MKLTMLLVFIFSLSSIAQDINHRISVKDGSNKFDTSTKEGLKEVRDYLAYQYQPQRKEQYKIIKFAKDEKLLESMEKENYVKLMEYVQSLNTNDIDFTKNEKILAIMKRYHSRQNLIYHFNGNDNILIIELTFPVAFTSYKYSTRLKNIQDIRDTLLTISANKLSHFKNLALNISREVISNKFQIDDSFGLNNRLNINDQNREHNIKDLIKNKTKTFSTKSKVEAV